MREAAWALLVAGFLLAALAPQGLASHGADGNCTKVNYAVIEGVGGSASYCGSGTDLPPLTIPSPGIQPPDSPTVNLACPEYGVVQEVQGHDVWACFTLDIEQPSQGSVNTSWINASVPSPGAPGITHEGCPETTIAGVVVEMGERRLGVCLLFSYQNFEVHLLQWQVDPVLTGCEIPEDDSQEGVDPAIRINDGGVAFCVVPVIEPGATPDPGGPPSIDDPPIRIDTEPCQPRATDPTVHVFDGHVQICIDAGVGEY